MCARGFWSLIGCRRAVGSQRQIPYGHQKQWRCFKITGLKLVEKLFRRPHQVQRHGISGICGHKWKNKRGWQNENDMAAHARATVTIQRSKDGLRGRETIPCAEWNSTGLHKVSFWLHFTVFIHRKSTMLPARLACPFTIQKSDLKCFHQGPVVSTWPSMRISMEVWMPYQWGTASSPSSPPSARRPRPCRSCCSPSSPTWRVDIWADRSASHCLLLHRVVCCSALLISYLCSVVLLALFFLNVLRAVFPPASCRSPFSGSSCECWTPVRLSRPSMTWVGWTCFLCLCPKDCL